QRTTSQRGRKGPHPPGHRKRLRQPETPDATRTPPRKDPPRPRPTHRPTPARAHHGHAPQHAPRPKTPQPRRLRPTLTHIKPLDSSSTRSHGGRPQLTPGSESPSILGT